LCIGPNYVSPPHTLQLNTDWWMTITPMGKAGRGADVAQMLVIEAQLDQS